MLLFAKTTVCSKRLETSHQPRLGLLHFQTQHTEGFYKSSLALFSGTQCYLSKSYAKYLLDKFDHPVRLLLHKLLLSCFY